MRYNWGTHEPQLVPHFSAFWNEASQPPGAPVQVFRCDWMATSVTLKQAPTCWPRDTTGKGWRGTRYPQRPAIRVGQQGLFKQGGDPALGADVASQQKAFQHGVCVGLDQAGNPALAAFWV